MRIEAAFCEQKDIAVSSPLHLITSSLIMVEAGTPTPQEQGAGAGQGQPKKYLLKTFSCGILHAAGIAN